MTPQSQTPEAEIETLKLALEETTQKYRTLQNNVNFMEQMLARSHASLDLATDELETIDYRTANERKMMRNTIFKKYFAVCDAIITLCKNS